MHATGWRHEWRHSSGIRKTSGMHASKLRKATGKRKATRRWKAAGSTANSKTTQAARAASWVSMGQVTRPHAWWWKPIECRHQLGGTGPSRWQYASRRIQKEREHLDRVLEWRSTVSASRAEFCEWCRGLVRCRSADLRAARQYHRFVQRSHWFRPTFGKISGDWLNAQHTTAVRHKIALSLPKNAPDPRGVLFVLGHELPGSLATQKLLRAVRRAIG